MNKKLFIMWIMVCAAGSTLFCNELNIGRSFNAQKVDDKNPRAFFDFMIGGAIPINASYVDTHENDDIYWNPNTGLNFDMRVGCRFNDIVSLAFPLDLIIGLYQYKTTDGRKINTEANAGNKPATTNTEWSLSMSFVPMVLLHPHKHPAVPYIGLGLGIGGLLSYESWDFMNCNDQRAVLIISKYYWPTPVFKGELSWAIPIRNRLSLRLGCVFNLANYIMRRVELTHYYINGRDTIGEWDQKSRIYTYGFDVPDENKGGDCLLAGFAYQNYPQQKISTSVSIKIGIAYNLEIKREKNGRYKRSRKNNRGVQNELVR